MSDRIDSCDKENILSQLLKVQAQVKITPVVKHGIPRVYLIDSGIKPRLECSNNECGIYDCGDGCYHNDNDYGCDYGNGDAYDSDQDCNFTLTQIIRVEIPISFDAAVSIKKGIQCCDIPVITSDCTCDFQENEIEHDPACFLLKNKVQF